MKNSAGLSALRALCQAGLPAESFIPAALEALHGIVPSYRNLFDWTDDAGDIVRYWFEGPIDHRIASHYFEQFYNRRECEVMPAFRHAIRAPDRVRSAQELDTPAFFRSALYNEVWRPQGLHTRVEVLVRTLRGRTLGSLVLYRAPGDAKFTTQDEHLLEQATVYLAQGIERGEPLQVMEFSASPARTAQVTLDAQGRLAHASAEAMKLLMLAHGGVTPEAVSREPRRQDFAALDALWQGRGRNRSSTVDNAWGRFSFDAEPMWPLGPGGVPLLQVTIAQFEPRVVTLRRALDRLPLSPAQREVCALVHRGDSQAEIARQLNVSATTVADHVRKIYLKLDVHSAKALSERISELAVAK